MIINEICWLYIELVDTSPMLKGGIIDEIDQGGLDQMEPKVKGKFATSSKVKFFQKIFCKKTGNDK